ncbi:MAG: hypothetical protein Q8N39_04205 [Pelolinea sp.]|nr:hypothetical protein [Pelolinea sp.]
MKSRKTALIILAAVILACVAFLVIGALYVPPAQRAVTYGVTDKDKSALVIHNNTSEFYILSVDVEGEITQKFTGVILQGDYKAYVLPPGDYSLTVHYSDRTSFTNKGFGSIEWYVDGVKLTEFTIRKGRAAIFSLRGGDVRSMTYDPPTLEDNSREVNPDQD